MFEATAKVEEEEVLRMQTKFDGYEVERLESAVIDLKAQISRLRSGVVEAIECDICNESLRSAIL